MIEAPFFYQSPKFKLFLKKIIAQVPYHLRLGKSFWQWYSFYFESEKWDIDSLNIYQLNLLRNNLYKTKQLHPYYQKILDKVDISQISINQFKELFPPLSRDQFRQINTDYKPNIKKRLQRITTSGTTGNPLQFYHLKEDWAREWASICYQWFRVGYRPEKSKRAEFRGFNNNNRLVSYYPHLNYIRCSILHLKKEHVVFYATEIKKNNIEFIHGYPSAIALLAYTIINENIKFPTLKGILLASEQVYEWQLSVIKIAFPNVEIFAHYGCAERTILGAWCEYDQVYHPLPQYSLIELDKQNNEILGTNLYNYINPFLRYRMTDTVNKESLSYEICNKCNRPYLPRFTIDGRKEDYLFSFDYGWIPPALITYPLKNLHLINEVQFIQSEEKEIIIKYKRINESNTNELSKELENIKFNLIKIIGTSTKIKFLQVDDFKRSPSGKFKWIVSEISNPFKS